MTTKTWEDFRRQRDVLVAAEHAAKGTRQLARMLARHGRDPQGHACGDCVHFVRANLDTAAKGYWKCTEYGVTGGPGTDWRVSWPACGLFEAPPLVER